MSPTNCSASLGLLERAAGLRPTVFVLHAVYLVDGVASCGCDVPDCKDVGKHPARKHNAVDLPAGTQPSQLVDGRGYGIATGVRSGVFVIDLDDKPAEGKHGSRSWAELEATNSPAPATFVVATPTGGRHLYFRHPGGSVKNSQGDGGIANGIDVRGDGGYVVAPGSPHKNGGTYQILNDAPVADAPAWLLALVRDDRATRHEGVAGQGAPTPIDKNHPEWAWRVSLGRKSCEQWPAQAGDGGTHLFELCQRLVRSLELPSDVAKTMLLDTWNPRATDANGAPWPWSEQEILHKLTQARDAGAWTCGTPGNVHLEVEGLTTEFDLGARLRADPDAMLAALASRASEDDETPKLGKVNCTDTGNAEVFAYLHRDRVRFVSKWKSWLVWDGARWKIDEVNQVQELTKDVIRFRWAHVATLSDAEPEAGETKVKRAKWASTTESKKARDSMLALASAETGIAVSPEDLDANPWLLNVTNGTIDLRTGLLRAHDRADLLTKTSPVAFDPEAVCPLWDSFLNRVTGGDADLASFLARAVGYSLTGDVGEQVLFFLQGGGANGKSTFTKIAIELLGEYAKQAAPDLLLAKHGESHPTEIADLHGARVALCQEVEQGRAWAEATLKQLTGGDRVKARRMGENFWEFEPTHKLWVCANHHPRVRGTDEGIWRRIKLVPFNVTIPEDERDPNLLAKLRAELPGILAWAIRGCLAWQRDGLKVPGRIKDATASYRKGEDLIVTFLDDECETGPGFEISKTALYRAFAEWAKTSGEHAPTKRMFGERIAERVKDGRTGAKGWFWKGLRLRTPTAYGLSPAASSAATR